MKQNFLILLLAAAALSSCDDDTVTPVQPQTTESKPMSFIFSTEDYQNPDGSGTRSGVQGLDDNEGILRSVLDEGILLTCYNLQQDSVVFSNYVYMLSEDDSTGLFTDFLGNTVTTPIWPGNDPVAFYACYCSGGIENYYVEYSEDEIYDNTMKFDKSSKHWTLPLPNNSAILESPNDILYCIAKTTRDENNGTISLQLHHLLSQFKVAVYGADTMKSPGLTDFSVKVPESTILDFTDGKIYGQGTDTAEVSSTAITSDNEEEASNGWGCYFYVYTAADTGTTYFNRVVPTVAGSCESIFWYLFVPTDDGLTFTFQYCDQITGDSTSVSRSGISPAAGTKTTYTITLPSVGSSTSGGTTTNDGGTVGTGSN